MRTVRIQLLRTRLYAVVWRATVIVVGWIAVGCRIAEDTPRLPIQNTAHGLRTSGTVDRICKPVLPLPPLPSQQNLDWPTRQEAAMSALIPDMTRLPPVDGDTFTLGDLIKEHSEGIVSDHVEFYSIEGLMWLAAGFGAGSLMANTGFDEHFLRDNYLENVVHISNDELSEKLHQPKFFGDGQYTIPSMAVAALAEPIIDDWPLGSQVAEWGQRSLRTILVGGPPMLGLQRLTGGSRPGESTYGSQWKPFKDNNGVSGHSFMGAVPFLSSAKVTDNFWLKAGFYSASVLPALSRVNDDDHYFSQAFLGWWIAHVASSAVERSHRPDANPRFFVYPHAGGVGVGAEYRL